MMILAKCLLPLLLTSLPAPAQTGGALPVPRKSVPRADQAPAQSPVVRRIEVIGGRGGVSNADLIQAAAPALGHSGSTDVIRQAADAVLELYRKRGFTVAQVIGSELDPAGVLRLTVNEGSIGQIHIRGNRKTREATILAALSLHPGDVYRESRIRADRESLARLGIFDDVSIAPISPGSEGENDTQEADPKLVTWATTWRRSIPTRSTDEVGQVDVLVKVVERKTANVAATLGYGQGNGLLGYFDLSEDNVAGTAQQATVQWQRTTRSHFESNGDIVVDNERHAYDVGYFAPLLGEKRFSYGIRLYDQNTVFLPFFTGTTETVRSYEKRRGGSIEVGRAIVGGVSGYVTARRDVVGYDTVPSKLNPPLAAIQDSAGTVGALGFRLTREGRDIPTDPHHGRYDSLTYERSGRYLGGNRPFAQTTLDLRQYTPLTSGKNGITLATRFLGGTSSGNVPLSEQYWLGGYELLRGYELYSIHGDRLFLTQAEARVPLVTGLQGVLFTDYGEAWEPGHSVSLRSLRADAGAGLRFLTPIGPIRLDAAYGSRLQTYISLGQAY